MNLYVFVLFVLPLIILMVFQSLFLKVWDHDYFWYVYDYFFCLFSQQFACFLSDTLLLYCSVRLLEG